MIWAEFNISLLNMIYNMRRVISLNALQKRSVHPLVAKPTKVSIIIYPKTLLFGF